MWLIRHVVLHHSASLSVTASAMSASPPQDDRDQEFTHHLAIKLSRALNTINPNDLLARRVQDIAKSNSLEGFVQGHLSLHYNTAFNTDSGFGFYSCQVVRQVPRFILSRSTCRDHVSRQPGGNRTTTQANSRNNHSGRRCTGTGACPPGWSYAYRCSKSEIRYRYRCIY